MYIMLAAAGGNLINKRLLEMFAYVTVVEV